MEEDRHLRLRRDDVVDGGGGGCDGDGGGGGGGGVSLFESLPGVDGSSDASGRWWKEQSRPIVWRVQGSCE